MNVSTDPHILAAPDVRPATLTSGIRLPYVATGGGAPLVFVHGSLCDYRYWNGQTEALAQHFLCIAVSLSHYWPGLDTGVHAAFSWKTHVDELAGFIDTLGLGPVHLVGHSRGGCVAFHLAHAYPHLVKSLTLADPGGPLQVDESAQPALPPATQALRARAAELIEHGEVDAGLELFVDSVSMPGIWRRSRPAFRTMAIDNAATLSKQFRDPLPAYTRAAAAALGCRALLIEGERSPRMFRDNVEKLAGWIPQVDKRSIAGASHGMNVTHAAVFNRLLRGFVNGCAG